MAATTKRLPKTMTAGEIRAQLSDFPDDKPVMFAYPSGDHWRTVLVGEIESVEPAFVAYTEYHQQFKLLDDESDENGTDEEITVIVLK